MLGWLLLGALIGAAVITIYVSFLDKDVARDKLREKNIKKAVVKDIVNSDGVTHVKLDAIDESGYEQQVDFEVDSYDSYEIRRGVTITV